MPQPVAKTQPLKILVPVYVLLLVVIYGIASLLA